MTQRNGWPVRDSIGSVIDGRFEVGALIAETNMASIYKAFDRSTGENVAVKIPLPDIEADVACHQRFLREEEIATLVDHPYIMKGVEPDRRKSRLYVATQLLEGETLGQRLAREGALAPKEALRIAAAVCDALVYLHGIGIIHRDLKPDNIILCQDGGLKLIDFGIARYTKARRLTFSGISPLLGTPEYMAPEQVLGKRGDERSDLYSLGAILYEMLTGSRPFTGETPYAIMNARTLGDPRAPSDWKPDVDAKIEEIVLHAMSRSPKDRHPSATALLKELLEPESVEPTGRASRLIPPAASNPGWQSRSILTGLIIAQVAIVGIIVVFLILRGHH